MFIYIRKCLYWQSTTQWFFSRLSYTCTALIEYSKTLDLSKKSDLHKFKFVNLLMLLLNGWTRFLHFGYIVIEIILTWYQDRAWIFLSTSAIPILAFTLFNAFVSVIPSYKRFMKFLNKSVFFITIILSKKF